MDMNYKLNWIQRVLLVVMGIVIISAGVYAANRTWTGAVSTDWNVAGNWSPASVPSATDDATVGGTLTNYPVITSSTTIHNLTINSGGIVSVDPGITLTVSNDMDVNAGGTFNLGGGILTVAHNLVIKGTFNAGSGSITLGDKFDLNGGTFNPGTSTVIMTESNKNIEHDAVTFYNLVIQNNTDGLTDITVLNDLTISGGVTLSMGANTLTVQGNILGAGSVSANAPYMTTLTILSTTAIDVKFSETVSLATSQNLANYSVNNGITVSSAVRDGSDNSLVHLTLSTLADNTAYQLTVSNVQDAGGTPIAPSSKKNFTTDFLDIFTITASASAGGSISPSGAVSILEGTDTTFTITANTGHHLDSVVVDGTNVGTPTTHTFTAVAGNHTIAAYFSPDVFVITASASAGGSISPSGSVNVNYGADQNFTVTPDAGYHTDSVVADGVNLGAVGSHSFTNVTAAHSIAAYFSVTTHTITASASAGGSISPSGSVVVNEGTDTTFTLTPNTGYHIDSVVVDGSNAGTSPTQSFTNVTGDHTIAAYFSIDVFSITASASAGGSVSPSGTTNVNYGSDQSYTVTPNTGYHTDSVVVDGVNLGIVGGHDFTNVTANHTIAAYFSIDVFSITASASAGGSVSPSGTTNVNYGSDQSYTVTPNTGYHTDSVVVDGVNLGVVNGHDFTSVTANHTIAAYFSIDQFGITASAGPNGSVTPAGVTTVDYDGSQAYTITPDLGYFVADVFVDSVSVGATSLYTFNNVTADHTINAVFAITQFTINASASAGGSITPSGATTVDYGSGQSYTVTPNTGYHTDSVVVDGVNLGVVGGHDFTNVATNHTIAAYFSIDVFTLTASASAGGSVSPSGVANVNYGSDQSYTVTPNTGYHTDSVVVDGVNLGAVGSHDFTNVTANHTIAAYFSIDQLGITASAGPNGSVTPAGLTTVDYDGSQAYTITPDIGYFVSDVFVDSVSVGATTSYVFNNVTVPHTIHAVFSIMTFPVTASAGPNGSVSPAGVTQVDYDGSQAYAITPDIGYFVSDVFVDSVSVGATTSYTFNNVTAAHSIRAEFAITQFSINASATAGGSISPLGSVGVNYDGSQSFTGTTSTAWSSTG